MERVGGLEPNKMNFKNVSVTLFSILAAGRILCAAPLDMGSPTSRTPYDAYMSPVWGVFSKLGGNQPDLASVQSYVHQGRAFRYYFNNAQPYLPQTPQQTESSRAGDCKAKSLWLAYKLDSRNVRYVIGKARLVSTISHAWLIWQSPGGWLILDATNFSQPLFSYAPPSGKYVHNVGAKSSSQFGDHL
jgi:hypothetical protein